MKIEVIELKLICNGPIIIAQKNDNKKAIKSTNFASFGSEGLNFNTILKKYNQVALGHTPESIDLNLIFNLIYRSDQFLKAANVLDNLRAASPILGPKTR